MKRRPTFELLCEVRQLPVVNPESGLRFTISLRDWEGVLWAVRVRPETLMPSDWDNPYVTAHRLMDRLAIEDWLSKLLLPRPSQSSRRLPAAAIAG